MYLSLPCQEEESARPVPTPSRSGLGLGGGEDGEKGEECGDGMKEIPGPRKTRKEPPTCDLVALSTLGF